MTGLILSFFYFELVLIRPDDENGAKKGKYLIEVFVGNMSRIFWLCDSVDQNLDWLFTFCYSERAMNDVNIVFPEFFEKSSSSFRWVVLDRKNDCFRLSVMQKTVAYSRCIASFLFHSEKDDSILFSRKFRVKRDTRVAIFTKFSSVISTYSNLKQSLEKTPLVEPIRNVNLMFQFPSEADMEESRALASKTSTYFRR